MRKLLFLVGCLFALLGAATHPEFYTSLALCFAAGVLLSEALN